MICRLRRAVASHPLATDSLLAAVLALVIGTATLSQGRADVSTTNIVGPILFTTAALPLAVRRRNPYFCVIVILALTIAGYAILGPRPPAILPAAVALCSVGVVARGRNIAFIAAGALVVTVGLGLLSRGPESIVGAMVFHLAWVVGALALGSAVANRRAYVEQIRQRAIQAEKTKEEEVQHRVDEERMRIARDVHDGVAHALASISIQAGAGSAVLDKDPEGARQAFGAIRAASGSALSELRSTLGLLRHDDDRSGTEGIDREQVERLVAVLRAEGIRVYVRGEDSDWALKGKSGTTVHRILQESLTNVLRHSGATEVELTVERTKKKITITVTDNGRGLAEGSGETRGYGLVGMRERASLMGGSVESGPRREGGFQVRATLPLGEGL